MTNPPKLRSFIDHRPETGDVFNPKERTPRTYVDHYPKTGDIRTTRQFINSYLDHLARPGDTRLQ